MQENTPSQAVEQIETVPDGAQAMKLVQGPDGAFYLVPESATADSAAPIEPASDASTGLFAWAEPILTDPLGWAQMHLLNSDVLWPYLLQTGVILFALLLGIFIAPQARHWVMSGVARLPDSLRSLALETAPRLVRPAL